MTTLPVRRYRAPDGAELAYREVGEGRPLVLIHGFFSTATVNWIRYGHAALLADRGFRVLMPDLRGHGDSAVSRAAADYPPDVLTGDGLAFVERLGLEPGAYDLAGYSLGARTAARMMVRGASPRRAVLAGMGLEGLTKAVGRGGFFRRVLSGEDGFERGTREWRARAFLQQTGGDPAALLRVLDSFTDTPREDLARVTAPTLVLSGTSDRDNGSAEDLAAALPRARVAWVPGNHMSAVASPDLGAALAAFLTDEEPGV
jgi:pimeloyl-ACP methyl ester carboxylesterase